MVGYFGFCLVGWVLDFFLVVKYKIKHKKYESNYEIYQKLTPKNITKKDKTCENHKPPVPSYEELQPSQICVLQWSMEEIRLELRLVKEFLCSPGFLIRHLQSLSPIS